MTTLLTWYLSLCDSEHIFGCMPMAFCYDKGMNGCLVCANLIMMFFEFQVRCEYSMANFSTGDRMRKPKGDRFEALYSFNCTLLLAFVDVCWIVVLIRRSTEISLVIRQTMEACIMTHLMPRSQVLFRDQSRWPFFGPS